MLRDDRADAISPVTFFPIFRILFRAHHGAGGRCIEDYVIALRGSAPEFLVVEAHQHAELDRVECARGRGDLLSGAVDAGDFHYACELVEFIRRETGDWFHIDVAAYPEYHPQARSPQEDLANFQRKVAAGANSAITQYFFNGDAYWSFVEACVALGIAIPIVPGIMPISSYTKLARFSDACGAEIPRWIRRKLESYGDDVASIRAFGIDVVSRLCEDLLDAGAPGLHFYTLNQATLTTTIWRRLGV
ncbi:MAG: methylenetetrahydrofolate reductase [NAD(P)H] [Betaproteobacteria bacterium]|nr:MAG: methylenetetrahydrofolate reductase [NAD(P)H] [Betaproteobacteria bacterium]